MPIYENGNLIFKSIGTDEDIIIPVLEKESLLKRWKITDHQLEKIILLGELRKIWDKEGKPLLSKFIHIQSFFDPFGKRGFYDRKGNLLLNEVRRYRDNSCSHKESQPALSEDQKELLLKKFRPIYQEMTYFALEDIEYADTTHKNQNENEKTKNKIRREGLSKLANEPDIRKIEMIEYLKRIIPECKQEKSQWYRDIKTFPWPNNKRGRRPKKTD